MSFSDPLAWSSTSLPRIASGDPKTETYRTRLSDGAVVTVSVQQGINKTRKRHYIRQTIDRPVDASGTRESFTMTFIVDEPVTRTTSDAILSDNYSSFTAMVATNFGKMLNGES